MLPPLQKPRIRQKLAKWRIEELEAASKTGPSILEIVEARCGLRGRVDLLQLPILIPRDTEADLQRFRIAMMVKI